MKDLVALIGVVAGLLWFAWAVAGLLWFARILLPGYMAAVARWVFFELRPLAVLLIVGMHAGAVSAGVSRVWLFTGLNIGTWLILRTAKDDDDRWKRRRRKLAERVRQQGARLVVVPATQGAR